MRRVKLAAERLGQRSNHAERIVFLHGFTQTGRSWSTLAERFADRYDCVLVDLPGHGGSTDVRLDLAQTASHIADQFGASTYVGYSLGGRVALHLAAQHGDQVTRLFTLGATPGIHRPTARADRRADDTALAEHIERIGVAAFLDEWQTGPLFRHVIFPPEDRSDRLRNTAAGLADSLRQCGTGTQRFLLADLRHFASPAVVAAGRNDRKFAAIGSRLAHAMPNARFRSIPNAGHAAHVEQPDGVALLLAELLSR